MRQASHAPRLVLSGLLLWVMVCICAAREALEDAISVQPLESVAGVRELRYEEAKAGPPVILEVVVISHLLSGFDGQSAGGGLFFKMDGPPPVGQKVRVEGNVTGGLYEPYVVVDRVEAIGTAPHPEPLVLLPEHIQNGAGDNIWLEAEGLLLDLSIRGEESRWAQAILVTGATELVVRFRNHHEPFQSEAMQELVGAKVRIRGSGAPLFNNSRQRIGTELVCPGVEHMEILQPFPGFSDLPRTPLAEIRSWNYRQEEAGLVRTRGVVTWVGEDEDQLVIQSRDHAALVRMSEDAFIAPGRTVDIVGLPTSVGFFVGLRFGEITGVSDAMEVPDPILDEEPLSKERPFQLVTLRGRLAETAGRYFSLQIGQDRLVPVHAPEVVMAELPAVGSQLEATGVKWVEASSRGEVRSMALELRTTDDLKILATPSWWTPARYILAISLLGICIVAALVWSVLLKRRVSAQTAEIQSQIETNAALEERNRIARELHDTLSQGFSGVAWQLSSVQNHLKSNPERAEQKLELASRMVEHSLSEARNSLVNLRSPILDQQSLVSAMESSARAISEAESVELRVDLPSLEHGFSESTQHEILRIVQEAVTNAVRHAQSDKVWLSLEEKGETIHLQVRDEGRGFDPTTCSDSQDHFGLRGMLERSARIGGKLEIQSEAGQGTIISLTLPT